MGYIGRNANGFNQVSQSALAVTVNGIDELLITTSSLNYSGSTIITGSVFISGALSVSGTLSNLSAGPANTVQTITTPSTTWTVNHNYNQRYVIVQALDFEFNQIIPKNITLTNENSVTLTFDTAESGYAIVSVGGGAFRYDNYFIGDQNATAKLATTGSNNFNGNQIITGSTTITGSLTVTGSTTISGSLTIIGSSTNIGTAISTVGSSTTITGSLIVTGSQKNIGGTTITGSLTVTGSSHTITGSLSINNGITGSLQGTASYVSGSVFTSINPALSSSYAATASLLLGSVENASTSSYIISSFFRGTNAAESASYAFSSSFANNAGQLNGQSASYYQNASNINTGTLSNSYLPTAINITSVTASFTGSLTGTLIGTSSWANNVATASYVTGAVFNLTNPASFAISSSYISGSISNAVSSSYAFLAFTASFANDLTNGYVKSLIAGDTRVSFNSSQGDVTMQINVSSSQFSQNGQILALATGMANTF